MRLKFILKRETKEKMETNKTLLLAKNISEVLYQVKNTPGLEIVGGCTQISQLPEKSLCTRNIAEMKNINRHELFIDFGPATTLNEILDLGEERIPKILYKAILNTANHFVRNMATLGGNICAKEIHGTLYAPLLALNATLRFRNAETQSFYTMPFAKFTGVPQNNVIVNIRVPNEDWDVSIFRRCGPRHMLEKDSASFCFLAKTEKSALINVRIVFAGAFVFSSRELENKLLGLRLPISEKAITDFSRTAERAFDEAVGEEKINPVFKRQFLNLTQYSLNQLV